MGLVHFEDGKVLFYPYTPSAAAGYAFMALFAITSAGHCIGIFVFRTRYFIPLILGGICETFGHYGRAWAGSLPSSPRPFMLQLMLILVSPVFISATVYITLGKYKQAVLSQPKRRCGPTSLFIIADIVAFCTQIGGGLVQITGNQNIMRIGDRVVLGGLIFQLVVLAGYLVLLWRFSKQAHESVAATAVSWKPYLLALVVCTCAIWIRNLVRAIEYVQGFHGFISENEPMLYIFDSALMLGVMILLGVLHPGKLLRGVQDRRGNRLYSMEGLTNDNCQRVYFENS